MRMRILCHFTAVALLALSLKGCVYLRLLEVKSHLSQFEKYFHLENKESLHLIFLKPILLREDILHLAKGGPTTIQESSEGAVWHYLFQKRPHGENYGQSEFDVPVDLFFVGERLNKITFPKKFIENLPRQFIIDSFRAIGQGEVRKEALHVSGSLARNKKGDEFPIPNKTNFLILLGSPTEEKSSPEASVWQYTYILKPGKPELGVEPPEAWAQFDFNPRSNQLTKANATFAGIQVSMTFENLTDRE